MNEGVLHAVYASMAPWLALTLLLIGRSPYPTGIRLLTAPLMAAALLLLPLHHFPLARWIAVLEANPSIILTALLTIAVVGRTGGPRLFTTQDWRAAWIFGAAASLILYPMGLGLTSLDPYTWGWEPALPLVITAMATVLIIRGNRFGIVLLLGLLGMLLQPMESNNAWDYLLDPIYGIFSLLAVLLLIIGRWWRKR
jgi:hypothetical protein